MTRLLLIGSCLLMLTTLGVGHAQAATGDKPVKRQPTELWSAFPLHEQPTPLEPARSGVLGTSIARTPPPLIEGVPEAEPQMSEPLSPTVVTAAMVLMLAVAAVALVIFNPVANRSADATAGRRSFGAPLRRARLQLLPDPDRRRAERPPPPPPRSPTPPPPPQQHAAQPPPAEPERQNIAVPAPVEPLAADEVATETCLIGWQRLYISSAFVAATASTKRTVAVSPTFRWWRSTPPRVTAAADRALATLVARLRERGWTHTGAAEEWFELEFSRASTAPPVVSGHYCTIEWERFYVTARFTAYLVDSGGGRKLLDTSPEFRWLHGRPPEETTQAREALDALVEVLRRSGFEPTDRGSEWFALRLTR